MMDQQRINTIELNGITLGYGDKVLLENAYLGFGWGEFTALLGRNGTGKSTLLKTIAGVLKPLKGNISVCGKPVNELSTREIASLISFVSTEEVKVANLRAYDMVALGRSPYTNWIGKLTDRDREIVERSLNLVGMSSFSDKSVDTLSDGERQRVMIARALAQDTPVILLDEPTAFLDVPNRYEICLLLKKLAHTEGKSILFSTHDLNIALELCDTIAVIDGRSFYYGTAQQLVAAGELQKIFSGTSLVFDAQLNNVRLK